MHRGMGVLALAGALFFSCATLAVASTRRAVEGFAGNKVGVKTMRPKHMRALLATALAIALVALSGCQSSPAPAPQAATPTTAAAVPTPAPATKAAASTPAAAAQAAPVSAAAVDACALLTAEEVQAAIGKAVVQQQDPTGDARASGCSYLDTTTRIRLASLAVFSVTPSEAKGIHEATKGGGRDQVDVPGIGEDAYWDKTFSSLDMLKGKYSVGLTIASSATVEAIQAAKTLGPKLLSRLP
jgi:hypothetical protein